MRKLVYVLFGIVLLAAVPSVFAGSTTIPVSLSESSPVLDLCTGDSFHYAIFSFTAEVSGTHSFAIGNGPSRIMDVSLFAKGEFDPTCLTNQKQLGFVNGRNGAFFSADLVAGETYEIIGTMGPELSTGSYEIVLTTRAADPIEVAAVPVPVTPGN